MKTWVKIVLPLAMFAVGYAGARAWSRPSGADVSAGEGLSQPIATVPSALRETATKRHGFEAHAAKMAASEAAMARGDFEALIALSDRGGGAALNAWAESDPVGLWAFMEAGGWERYGEVFSGDAMFRNWFRLDPDAAVAALGGRWTCQMAIYGLLFDDDPAVVRAVGERLEEIAPGFQPQPGEHGSRHWRNGLSVVERMRSLPESPAKARLIATAVGGWAERDWREARDWAVAQPEAERAVMLRAIFSTGDYNNLMRDPEGIAWAAEFLSQDDNREMRMRVGPAIAAAMAREDAVGAMRWAEESLGGVALASAVGGIVSRQLSKDREAAFAMVDALPPGGVRRRAGHDLVWNLRNKDPKAAFERAIHELSEGYDIGHQAWGQVGIALGRSAPEEGRQILSNLPDGVPPVFENWMMDHLPDTDPEGTLRWAAELGGERGDRIAKRVLQSWKVRDPVAAGKWVGDPETNIE